MHRYESVGDLLEDFRKINEMTKCQIAEWIGVDPKSYTRWEKNRSPIHIANMDGLAEKTKIPFEVLFRLNHEYPTIYDVVTNRYAACPFDKDYVNREILQEKLFDTEEEGNLTPIRSPEDIREVTETPFPLYYSHGGASQGVKLLSFKNLPELNLILRDPVGYYSGHLICFPLKLDYYDRLRSREIEEAHISEEGLAVPPWNEPVAIHVYSIYATCSTYVYCIMKRIVYYILLNIPDMLHPDSLVSRYAVTEDGNELCKKMDMKRVYFGHEDLKTGRFQTRALPHFWEAKISDLKWVANYKDKI